MGIFLIFFYFLILGTIVYVIFKWVNRYFAIKEEQNDLLRDIINRFDRRFL